jgi:hypothetical protein
MISAHILEGQAHMSEPVSVEELKDAILQMIVQRFGKRSLD